jgi:hypothetical protein
MAGHPKKEKEEKKFVKKFTAEELALIRYILSKVENHLRFDEKQNEYFKCERFLCKLSIDEFEKLYYILKNWDQDFKKIKVEEFKNGKEI